MPRTEEKHGKKTETPVRRGRDESNNLPGSQMYTRARVTRVNVGLTELRFITLTSELGPECGANMPHFDAEKGLVRGLPQRLVRRRP